MSASFQTFQQFATVLLAALTGWLIALPLTAFEGAPALLLGAAGLLLGAGIGYRRRDSRGFFYLTLIAVLVLSSVMYGALLREPSL